MPTLNIGLFLVSTSLLMVQILFLRFSRTAFIFNLQFIMISCAIWGLGLGNIIVYLWFNNKVEKQLGKIFLICSILYSIFSLIPFFVLHLSNFYPQFLVGIIFFITELLAYIFAGVLIGLTFRYNSDSKKVFFLYFISMLGSGLGAFLVIYLLDSIGIYTIIVNFIFTLGACIFYSIRFKFYKVVYFFLFLILLIVIFSSWLTKNFRIICYPEKKLISSLVNSYSQVDLYQIEDNGLSTKEIDFECIYNMPLDNSVPKNQMASFFHNFPYLIKKYDRTVIIGPGAGREVAGAVANKLKNIIAVELNPQVVKTVYKANSNNIYENKSVHLVIAEGRNYISTSKEKFDLIYIATTKNFGTIGLKALALQENYLYTKEAIESYLKHLSEGGIIAIQDRSFIIPQYLTTLKLALLSVQKNSQDVILIDGGANFDDSGEGGNKNIILYKNHGFTKNELADINKQAKRLNYKVYLNPTIDPNVRSITMDRPYFDSSISLNESFLIQKSEPVPRNGRFHIFQKQAIMLIRYITIVLFTYYVFFLLILLLKSANVRKAKFILGLFTLTGIGFVCAELYFIEKISLFLGNPSFSIGLGLSLLLIFGGLGNLIVRRFNIAIFNILLIVILPLLIYTIFFDTFVTTFETLNFWPRLVIVILMLSVPSLGMGILFGRSLKIINSISKTLLPVVLAIDGFASVLGGFIFKLVAFYFGLGAGLAIAIVSYIGIFIILRAKRQ